MASGGHHAEEVQKRVEDEITCPMCQDHFEEPKILPCFHYYCKKCIQTLALRSGENRPFACPECRSDTLLPQNDASQLPTAFFVNRIKELHTKMEKAQGKVEAVCEQCSGGKATAFCRHCTEFICEKCVECHQKLKVFAGHKVSTLEELKQGETKDILIKKPPPSTCKDHDQPMSLFCFDCNRLICRDCIVIDHKEHKYDFVKKAAPTTKEKLNESLAPLKEIQVSLDAATNTVRSTKSDVETQGASTATAIKRSFDKLHEIIEQRKREMLEKASSVTKRKLDRLTIQEKGFDVASGMIHSLVDFVEQNIENATEEELMTIHMQVLNRVKEETRKHQCSSADLQPVEKANMMVQVDCERELKKICQEKANLLEFSVEGGGKISADVGKPTTIQVMCKSMNPFTIESKLASVRGTVRGIVQKKEHDVYEIELVPKVRDRYKMEITVNGLPVAGSPFPVFMKICPTQLSKPVKVIGGVNKPLGVAVNSAGEIIVAERTGDVVVLNTNGQGINAIQKSDHGFKELKSVAVDKDDNIFVTDLGSKKLFKFNRKFELVTVVQREQGMELFDPQGVTVCGEQVVVGCRSPPSLYIFNNNLVLNMKVNLKRFGITDVIAVTVANDEPDNLYICDYRGGCVHVLSLKGQVELLYSFGKGQLTHPRSIYIMISDGLVYVSDWSKNAVFVFTKEGKFVTSFGSIGSTEGQFAGPCGLVVDSDGILYVCDILNNRVQLF